MKLATLRVRPGDGETALDRSIDRLVQNLQLTE